MCYHAVSNVDEIKVEKIACRLKNSYEQIALMKKIRCP